MVSAQCSVPCHETFQSQEYGHNIIFLTKFLGNVYVVVNVLLQVIFVFLLFLGLVMYANEVETKEKQKLPEIKINYNIYNSID